MLGVLSTVDSYGRYAWPVQQHGLDQQPMAQLLEAVSFDGRLSPPTAFVVAKWERYHILQVHLKRQGRNHYKSRQLHGKLALVDLAGSERAAETNNFGQKLRDGANINRSLLSLANCINQLGKAGASGGRAYIPYRNSKLTRLLKVCTACVKCTSPYSSSCY